MNRKPWKRPTPPRGVLESKNDFEVLDLTPQFIPDMAVLKKAYRKISLAVHPDKCLGLKKTVKRNDFGRNLWRIYCRHGNFIMDFSLLWRHLWLALGLAYTFWTIGWCIPGVGSWETCFSFPWGTNIRKQRMLFDAWLHFDWDIIFLLSNPSLPHGHCIAETSMDKDNDAEGIWHKKGRCGKGSCVAQEKSMVLLKRWWTSGSRGDYFGSWGNWPQTWRSRWATFWLMTCHDRLTCRLKIWIAGHVWWGGRGWTLPVVVGSHGSWNWEAGGGIWGPNSIQKIATDLSIKKHREFMAFQATVEGQQFDEYGAMWISDGLGGVTWQCWCCFQTTVRKSQSLNFIPKSWKDKCLGRWYIILVRIDTSYHIPIPNQKCIVEPCLHLKKQKSAVICTTINS